VNLQSVVSAFGSLLDPVESLDARFVVLALAFHTLNLVLRAVAWRNALAAAFPASRVPLVGVGAAYAAGVAVNGFVPGRGGEAAKIALVRMQLPRASVVTITTSSSVILLLDAVVGGALLLAAWSIGLVPNAPQPPQPAAAATVAAAHPWTAGGAVALVAVATWLVGRRVRERVRPFRTRALEGLAVLRSPARYARGVALPQLGAWACRIGFTFALLLAFGLPATVPLASTVVVVGGMSTLVPATPGGVGTQQVLLVYVLHHVATTAQALSFSIGVQAGVTAVNALVGMLGAMLVIRTIRPFAVVRALRSRD
jgi:uncharacterized membrane protein YbhN (UPF0104 family)